MLLMMMMMMMMMTMMMIDVYKRQALYFNSRTWCQKALCKMAAASGEMCIRDRTLTAFKIHDTATQRPQ